MYRRELEAISAAIKGRLDYYRNTPGGTEETRSTAIITTETLAQDIAKAIEQTNPSRDTGMFLRACGVML